MEVRQMPEEQLLREIQIHNRILLLELQKGDLVQFQRGVYQHWAVYIGNGEIVHVTGDSCSTVRHAAQIRHQNFWYLGAGFSARKANFDDQVHSPLPGNVIRSNALRWLGPVRLAERNCEHFAKQCRYGEAISAQTYGLSYFKYATALAVFVVLVACAFAQMNEL